MRTAKKLCFQLYTFLHAHNVTLCVHYARYVKFGYDLVLQKWTFTTAPHTRVAPHWTFDFASFVWKLHLEHSLIYF